MSDLILKSAPPTEIDKPRLFYRITLHANKRIVWFIFFLRQMQIKTNWQKQLVSQQTDFSE